MSLMEMEIDEEDFAGPDVAGLIIYGYSNSRFAVPSLWHEKSYCLHTASGIQ